MKHSKPGRKLSESLKSVIDPIYKRDPQRYARLILWVWRNQKQGYPDEALVKCIELAGNNIHTAGDWWKYLTKLLPKSLGRANEDESQEHKRGDMGVVMDFMEFLKERKRA